MFHSMLLTIVKTAGKKIMLWVCTPSSMMCMYRRFGGMSERTHDNAPGARKSRAPVC
jgi:hypothetical protein